MSSLVSVAVGRARPVDVGVCYLFMVVAVLMAFRRVTPVVCMAVMLIMGVLMGMGDPRMGMAKPADFPV